MYPSALALIGEHKYGWVALPVLGLLIAFFVWGVQGEVDALSRQGKETKALWFAECSKPPEDCARSWDEISSLREIYRDRVPLDR